MSIQRYRFVTCSDEQLADQIPSGAVISANTEMVVDIDLNNDVELPILDDFMEGCSAIFVETAPPFAPSELRESKAFSQEALALPALTDRYCVFSGPNTGTIGASELGTAFVSTINGRVSRVGLQSSVGMTVDLFVLINAARTVVETPVLVANALLTVQPLQVGFQPGDLVSFGLQSVGGIGATDLRMSLYIEGQ